MITASSVPGALIEWLLVAGLAFVVATTVIKTRQLRRWRVAQAGFESALARVVDPGALHVLAQGHRMAPTARLVGALVHAPVRTVAVLDRAIVGERRRVMSMMVALATTAAVAPFVGLLGTVWGILTAFLRIGEHGTASLGVVAPAVGEALAATALGLVVAIPAVAAYNLLGRALDDLVTESRAVATLVADRFLGGLGGSESRR